MRASDAAGGCQRACFRMGAQQLAKLTKIIGQIAKTGIGNWTGIVTDEQVAVAFPAARRGLAMQPFAYGR